MLDRQGWKELSVRLDEIRDWLPELTREAAERTKESGEDPITEACADMLAVDAAGYLLCGERTDQCENHLCWPLADREPHMLETVRPGAFAAGDVRAGGAKRVAGAVGDGALTVRFACDVLAG